MTQFLIKELTLWSLLEHPLQSKLVPLDRQIKHLWFAWSQGYLSWLAPILHMQASQDPWRVVSLLSKPSAQSLQSKSSFKYSLHLTQDIVPLSNSLHAADEMFLRHVRQWIPSLSVKLTAMRENVTNVCLHVWLKNILISVIPLYIVKITPWISSVGSQNVSAAIGFSPFAFHILVCTWVI